MTRPFLRWVGGKQRLVTHLSELCPDIEGMYYEPFLGAGSLLLNLQPQVAIVGDVNKELINSYHVLQGSDEDLAKLETYLKAYKNEETAYYSVRAQNPDEIACNIERAARFIYLNRTCYGGLYRENKSGKFNVSYGKMKRAKHDTMHDIYPVAKCLRSSNIKFMCAEFQETLATAKEGDFVYLDPPYYPVTAKSFVGYHKHKFDFNALYDTVCDLDDRGCYFMMSNSDCPENREQYKDFDITGISLTRTIRPELAKGRKEIIVKNYEFELE